MSNNEEGESTLKTGIIFVVGLIIFSFLLYFSFDGIENYLSIIKNFIHSK